MMKEYLPWIHLLITIVVEIVAQQTSASPSKGQSSQSSDTSKLDDESRELFWETVQGHWKDYETTSEYWREKGRSSLRRRLSRIPNKSSVAKNVIFFMGDGMSISTLTAARIYWGQLHNHTGEEQSLHWEDFPYTGLVKTWCLDAQVPDSACTATAYLSGIKTKFFTLGLNGKVKRGHCDTQIEQNYVDSILKWAQEYGKATGIVTTTRITDPSPAAAYAHSAFRKWETDADMAPWKNNPRECPDIATQLIRSEPGKNFKVILGGGRRGFLPNTTEDEEGIVGRRWDGKNLIQEWKMEKQQRSQKSAYIWNKKELYDVINNPRKYDYVLGLFDSSHFPYHLNPKSAKKPTLSEMTKAAIKVVQREKNGYFLFIEGGMIDNAHHHNYAKIALDETVELSKAVRVAKRMTSTLDTLIIVTADHGHTMTMAGFPRRGNPINGMAARKADDAIPYSTLSYQSGPGYRKRTSHKRYDPTKEDYHDNFYQSPALVPLKLAAHSGEDVAIFARGPMAELFTGTMEQSDIPYFVAYAACIQKYT